MEDSTAKTIDYLRARLLAERSVSRTARQRAYELAKRVTELEKQLKYVSLQRKKAEKATVDVLTILENHGRNDLSEQFDSSSDQEDTSSGCKIGKHVEKSENEGFSGSEVESSSVNGKSLSWKSSKNSSSRFLDKKYLEASRRRRSNSLTSTGSSPRRVGKSCRQIRHKENRSATDESQNNDATNGVQNNADVATETSQEGLNIHEKKDSVEVATSSCSGHAVKSYGTEREMERALKKQARFIAQYEEEEKAQREWEDKFRQNNGSPPDSCDPGTHSDVTEEREEIKAPPPPSTPPPPPPPPHPTNQLTPITQEINTNFNEEPKLLPSQNNIDPNNKPSDNQNKIHPPELQGTTQNFSPLHVTSSSQEQTSGNSYDQNPDKLGSVLEALQQAKLSLKQNLDKFPLLENGPSIPGYRSRDKFMVPFSPTAGLFRLPTDYEYGGTRTPTRADSLTYDPRLSLTNYPNDRSESRFISSPYRESFSRSTTSLDDRFRMVPTFPYQETMPEITRLPPSTFNPRLDMGPYARDPRLDVGMGPSAHDPRLGAGPSVDPRLGVRQTALDPRLGSGVGQSAFDPRLGSGVGQSAFDPRLEMGPPFTSGASSRHETGRLPNGDIPIRTRSLYDDYTR